MTIKRLYEIGRNLLLRAIAYKFEVRTEISEMFGNSDSHRVLVRDLSRLVSNEYSGKDPNREKEIRVYGKLQRTRL